MLFSIIVPVYNRPQEIDELLASLCRQTVKDFEVVIVEDGSSMPCKDICKRYADQLDIRYLVKPNGGPSAARNFGAEHAQGEYLLILDSDIIAPDTYLEEVRNELQNEPADAFGGPDAAHPDFSPTQKAISYSMTSFLTTGGIRGGKKKMDKFYPRSFNLGVKREVFQALHGFDTTMRFGEDIDFSIRIFANNYRCRLFPKAWVYHKRRSTFRQFFKQVHNSGIARIHLYMKYPKSLKLVHLLPTVFTLGVFMLIALSILGTCLHINWLTWTPLGCLLAYCLGLFLDAAIQSKSIRVGYLAIVAAFVQLIGYGTGFLRAVWHCLIRKETDFQAFRRNFYK
jgi:glycosyltransferase involved in cell wall biosynthesis